MIISKKNSIFFKSWSSHRSFFDDIVSTGHSTTLEKKIWRNFFVASEKEQNFKIYKTDPNTQEARSCKGYGRLLGKSIKQWRE